MTEAKRMILPYIPGLEAAADMGEFSRMLESAEGKGGGAIDTVNWPEDFPYRPQCSFMAGWCSIGIGILYSVKGMDIRAMATEDNGRVWEDSCCEFFVSDPADGTYYNFEMNCIGTLLAAKRKSREDCVHFSAEKLQRVRRFSTFDHKVIDIQDKEFSWQAGIFIPFSLIGVDRSHIPSELHANFYKCGDLTAHIHFLSWSPINCPKPDFHRPDFFGTLELEPAPVPASRKIASNMLSPVMLVLYFLILFFLCFWKFGDLDSASRTFLGIPVDKIVHFCMFFPFPPIAYATFLKKLMPQWKSAFFILIIFCVGCIIAGGTELGQSLTTYRSCDITDFRADTFSLAASSVLTLTIDAIRRRRRRR